MEESITLFPEIKEGAPLTINGDPPDVEPCMIVKGVYLSVFYCLFYDTDISKYTSEEQVVEERYPELNEMEDIRFDEIWEDHWRNLAEKNNNKKRIRALRWNV